MTNALISLSSCLCLCVSVSRLFPIFSITKVQTISYRSWLTSEDMSCLAGTMFVFKLNLNAWMWGTYALIHCSSPKFSRHIFLKRLFLLVPTQALVSIWVCNPYELVQIPLIFFFNDFPNYSSPWKWLISLNSLPSLNLLFYLLQLEIRYCFKMSMDLMIKFAKMFNYYTQYLQHWVCRS